MARSSSTNLFVGMMLMDNKASMLGHMTKLGKNALTT